MTGINSHEFCRLSLILPRSKKSISTHHEAVQYGQYYAQRGWEKDSNPMVMTSMMLYLGENPYSYVCLFLFVKSNSDRMTNVNLECEEYSKTQLLSDIGGAGKFGFFLLFQK